MAKISLQDSGKFSTGGQGGFFSLADDGDIAKVRFLYEEEDGSDVDYYVVHEVEIDGKKRYVNCLAVDDEGHVHKEDCPLCQEKYKMQEKLFLQLYNSDKGEVQVWERGKNFVKKILSYINRYGSLCAQEFEIERKGKKGDTSTTYEFFAMKEDGMTLADFDQERQELLGGLILDCSAEDMEDILDGVYKVPGSEDNQSSGGNSRGGRKDEPVRRRSARQDEPVRRSRRDSEADEEPVRRSRRSTEEEPEPTRRSRRNTEPEPQDEPQAEEQPTGRRRRVTRG